MSFREVILHNFWLKLISLGLGALIWLGVRYQIQEPQGASQPRGSHPVFKATYKVRVSIITPGDGRAYRLTPREVMVVVLGEDAVLRNFAPSNLLVYADLTDFNPKKQTTLELRSHAPPQVIIGDIQPGSVQVEQLSP